MIDICSDLHSLIYDLPRYHFPYDDKKIPLNGIYLLFEDGENGHGKDRIVRIGTHTGSDQLRSRLSQHFVTENKDRSIFRKNIGRALLSKEHDPFLKQWDIDLTTREAREKHQSQIDLVKQKKVERQVTEFIQCHFQFAVFQVIEKDVRLLLESRIISTVSSCHLCGPSNTWLGLFSPKERIRRSGLWIVNELYKQPISPSEFELLSQIIGRSKETG